MVEKILSMAGLGEFVERDFFIAQVGLLGGSALLFVFSLVVCILAFRAAVAARGAQRDSELHFASSQDLATEMRQLTAQVEQSLSGERAPVGDATAGIASASIPTAQMILSDDEAAGDVDAAPHAEQLANETLEHDEAFAHVDPDDPYAEGTPDQNAFISEGEDAAGQSASLSPLARLIRRRRNR